MVEEKKTINMAQTYKKCYFYTKQSRFCFYFSFYDDFSDDPEYFSVVLMLGSIHTYA